MWMLQIILNAVIGCGLLIAAFKGKTFYQARPGTSRHGPPLPLWIGRLIFVLVGSFFLLGAFQQIRHK
jgi:hypothetical protein